LLSCQFFDNKNSEMNQMLVVGMIATNDAVEFCDVLRDVVELP